MPKLDKEALTHVLLQAVGLYLVATKLPALLRSLAGFILSNAASDNPPIAWRWQELVLVTLRDNLVVAGAGVVLLLATPRILQLSTARKVFDLAEARR